MDELFNSISEEIEKKIDFNTDDTIDFSHLGYTTFPFSENNFHEIQSTLNNNRICFVDGGNAELFSSSSLNLSFVRIFHSTYKDNKRISLNKDEFFCLVTTEKKLGQLIFSAKLFPKDKTFLSPSFFETEFYFDPTDPALTTRNSRIGISHIPNIIRRLAELSTSLLLTKELSEDDAIIIDGSFEAKLKDEERLINTIKMMGEENKIAIAGLCKTTNLLTSSGQSPILALQSKAPINAWFYFPVADAPFHLYFVKLHEKSDYIFRLDLLSSKNASQVLSTLKQNSIDPVFLGYPYGLVEADRFARVSNQEKEYLTTTFMTKTAAKSEKLRLLAKSLDAHSILDTIS